MKILQNFFYIILESSEVNRFGLMLINQKFIESIFLSSYTIL